MEKIFEINRAEVEKKADEYISNLKYDATDEEKKTIKEMYVANGLKQLEKLKNAHDLAYRKLQKSRAKAKAGRKQNLQRIRGHK